MSSYYFVRAFTSVCAVYIYHIHLFIDFVCFVDSAGCSSSAAATPDTIMALLLINGIADFNGQRTVTTDEDINIVIELKIFPCDGGVTRP